jgi:hypothetical protein
LRFPHTLTPLCSATQTQAADAALAARRAAALRAWAASRLGAERAALATLLGARGVLCRGGADGARTLMDDLLAWKAEGESAPR